MVMFNVMTFSQLAGPFSIGKLTRRVGWQITKREEGNFLYSFFQFTIIT